MIPFFAGDVKAALRLLRWIGDLGGCGAHDCLLVADADTPWPEALECKNLAMQSFRATDLITNGEHVEGWIAGSNSLFKAAAQFAQDRGQSFLFLEPDAVPLAAGWLDKIAAEYSRNLGLFIGSVVHHGNPHWPNPYFEGVGVYPSDAWRRMQPHFTCPSLSWTRSCAPAVVPKAINSPLFQHLWGEVGNPPTFAESNVPGTNCFCLKQLQPQAVLFHRNKDGSLIRLLQKARGLLPAEKTFCHGGDVGDLIYGLCAMLAAGGGSLWLVPHAVREPFTAHKAELILPLILVQPYIRFATFLSCPIIPFGNPWKPDFVQVNFNPFRPLQFQRRARGLWENIAASHLRLLGLDLAESERHPWLVVDYPVPIPGKPVVFHRSPRYHNPHFPWKRVWQEYRNKAVFIGTEWEHRQFAQQVGFVPFHRTENFLEAARVIEGCQLFVGNQSAPYAIAEGLKQNAILEVGQGVPDCIFHRSNLQNNPAQLKLPAL